MTEIPEHLLKRSRDRRAALGDGEASGGDEGGAGASAESGPAESAPAASAPAVRAETAPAAAAPAAAPAVVDEAPSPIMLADEAVRRTRIPIWAVPVLVLLPFWAFLYAGAFGERGHEGPVDPLELGREVYARAGCAACHGSAGEGGTGPALAGDDAEKTFPDAADHEQWVREGSATKAIGTAYGDPDRDGGQRTVKSAGMPGFQGTLSEEEIKAVVQFEREQL